MKTELLLIHLYLPATSGQVILMPPLSASLQLSRPRGRTVIRNVAILGNSVLAVMAGAIPVSNLSQPVRLFFANPEKVK